MRPTVPFLCDMSRNKRTPSSTRAIRMIARMMVLVCPLDAVEVPGGVLIVAEGTCGAGCTYDTGGVVCIKGLGRRVGLGGAIYCSAGFPGELTIFLGGSNVGDGEALGAVLDVPVM
jgi:hypothetical protein